MFFHSETKKEAGANNASAFSLMIQLKTVLQMHRRVTSDYPLELTKLEGILLLEYRTNCPLHLWPDLVHISTGGILCHLQDFRKYFALRYGRSHYIRRQDASPCGSAPFSTGVMY